MSKQIQVNKKISEKNHSSLFFVVIFFLIKKYNFKNIILLFYKFKGRKKWLVFILFFKKFPNHRGILVRKHQKLLFKTKKNTCTNTKRNDNICRNFGKKKRLRNALVQDCQH